jgi:carbonic anhydrase
MARPGDLAPEKWGQLSPDYAACSTGSSQAPLNIVTAKTVKDTSSQPLMPAYVAGPAEVKNTGTGIQVNLKGDLRSIQTIIGWCSFTSTPLERKRSMVSITP